MGQWWSQAKQPKEIRNIYVELAFSDVHCYPIQWPDTFNELQAILQDMFNQEYNTLEFEDAASEAGGQKMRVINEESYAALVPKHLAIGPEIHLYYVGLKLPGTDLQNRTKNSLPVSKKGFTLIQRKNPNQGKSHVSENPYSQGGKNDVKERQV